MNIHHQLLGKTTVRVPPIIFGTSCLGSLDEVLPDATKLETMREMFRQMPAPVALDSAGKYGAGLALEVALNTSQPERIADNGASMQARIRPELWCRR